MVNAMISTPVLADAKSEKTENDASLSQVEFFLFLADSIEIDNTLTTPLDIEHYQDASNNEESLSSQTEPELEPEEDQP